MTTRKTWTIAGLSAATVITGAALTAAALPEVAEATASAAPTSESTAAPSTPGADGSDATPPAHDPSKGGPQANGITEELLTGDAAEKVTAAVQAEYPDATIQRVENDAEGDAYEAHILQADGSPATVKLDESFAVIGVETGGPGGGGRDGSGRPPGADSDDPTGSGQDDTSSTPAS